MSLLFIGLFSFGIEFVQYFIGRATDIDDFILNVTGGIAGYFILRGLKVLFRRWKSAGFGFRQRESKNA